MNAKARTFPPLAGADQDHHDELLEKIAQVRAIQRQYAAAVIGAGVFHTDTEPVEHWSGVLGSLAEPAARQALNALNALFKRLEAAQPGSTSLSYPSDDPIDRCAASDVVFAHAVAWGDAGFELGLAVGMQLGPHAFDGLEADAIKRKRGDR